MESSKISNISSRIVINETLRVEPSNQSDKDYLCPVCDCIISDPLGCNKCKQHLCRTCIQDWREKGKNSCPISGCEVFVQEKAHPFFFKYLSSIKLKCPNSEKGCTAIISHQAFTKHVNTCEYKPWQCNNEGCTFESAL